MRHNRRDDGQLSCRKREMKTMNANTALDGHTTVIKMAERGGVPLKTLAEYEKDSSRNREKPNHKGERLCYRTVVSESWKTIGVYQSLEKKMIQQVLCVCVNCCRVGEYTRVSTFWFRSRTTVCIEQGTYPTIQLSVDIRVRALDRLVNVVLRQNGQRCGHVIRLGKL